MKLIRNIRPEFRDARGDIFKILDDGKTIIKSVLLITCNKGAIRANHYHKRDSHFVYMLSGAMEYTEQPVNKKGAKKETALLKAGDLIYSPPMVAHAMKFLKYSVFIALAARSRSQKDYEKDTVRIKLI